MHHPCRRLARLLVDRSHDCRPSGRHSGLGHVGGNEVDKQFLASTDALRRLSEIELAYDPALLTFGNRAGSP